MEEGWGLGGEANGHGGKASRREGVAPLLCWQPKVPARLGRYENDMTDGDWLTGYRLGMRT
jgi:hypothetical protein